MIFSYNWLRSFFARKLPKPDRLAELLTLHSFEVSEVKKVKGDYVLDIDVLPNRAGDCFSHIGIARECAALLNSKFEIRSPKQIQNSKFKIQNFVSVEIKQPQACSRYTARVITDVKVGPSPKWLKDRLEVCGLNSINNIVDVTNYVMLETGQPMHAFDFEKLAGAKIIVRFAKEGEKIITLDGQKFNLESNVLVISDSQKPIAIAGIKGGKDPGIDQGTKIVVLETANFNPTIIRKGSRELSLKTDASLRFEHGVDPNLTEFANNRAAYLIQKVACPQSPGAIATGRRAGGQSPMGLIDVYPKKVLPKKIRLDLNYVESLLGVKISEREIRNILKRLGFKIKNLKLKILDVAVPTSRPDILIPEDLIEEIGRVYGYENILPSFPVVSLIPPKKNEDIFWENMIKDILREAGFNEVYNRSFVKDGGSVELLNPLSQEQKYLRPSLIPNLLKNIEKNIKSFSQIKIFELGKIFNDKIEKRMLTGVAAEQDFYQLKGIIDALFNKLGIAKVWYDDYEATPEDSPKSLWHPQKSAEIKIGDVELGFLGELKNEHKLVVFDIDFEKLKTLVNKEHEYRPISSYPAAIRDLAVLVPLPTKVEEVLNVIEAAGGLLTIDVDLFDIYEGEGIPEGKKNLAFHIIYQSSDHTLTSIEIYKTHQKMIKALEENSTWQVRR